MIIDCHGHYTTAPDAHVRWREAQLESYAARQSAPPYRDISDADIRASLETNQLRLMTDRGIDVTLFSPRASAMAHHAGDADVGIEWARRCNDLIARAVSLFPERLVGVAQLPQHPGEPLDASVAELRRAVDELGFVGCNLSIDPSGGQWTAPPLQDAYWHPMYEALSELRVPAMIHVSATVNPAFHATGSHYLNADTTAFMQLLQGTVFEDFPQLQLIIPHGGGAVPYHWGRFRGLADMLGRPGAAERLLDNVWFDTCVYHQDGIDLLLRVVGADHVLFGSEMIGAVRGIDPQTGQYFDDTKRYVDAAQLTATERAAVYEDNARRVFPRLANLH